MFFKKNFDSEKVYCIYPRHIENSFIKLLNLLTNESILLTFNEREMLYEKINFIINFLQKAQDNDNNS